MKNRDNTDFDFRRLRLFEFSSPQPGVGLGAALEQFAMPIGVIHGGSE